MNTQADASQAQKRMVQCFMPKIPRRSCWKCGSESINAYSFHGKSGVFALRFECINGHTYTKVPFT